MTALFAISHTLIDLFLLSTAPATPVDSWMLTSSSSVWAGSSGHEAEVLAFLLGSALIFLATCRVMIRKKSQVPSRLYLAKVYLSQKDSLWKS